MRAVSLRTTPAGRLLSRATRDPSGQSWQPDRAAELAEGLCSRITARRVRPGGEVCGRELPMAKTHAAVLEEQPAQPPDRRALVAVRLVVKQQPTDHQGVVGGGGAGRLATAARTAARLPRSKAPRKIVYGDPCDIITGTHVRTIGKSGPGTGLGGRSMSTVFGRAGATGQGGASA